MRRQPREYALADLIEDPALGLAMEHQGIDRRTIELLLDQAPRPGRAASRPFEPLFAG